MKVKNALAGPVVTLASRCASARVRLILAAESMRMVSPRALSESIGQCETRSARLPA